MLASGLHSSKSASNIVADRPQPLSELLQHELDHLDGVLLTDRALDQQSLISREEFDKNPQRFAGEVDYFISPTIAEG